MLIENILFENIVMDRIYGHPIRLKIDDHEGTHAEMEAIRKLYFHNIRARGLKWPSLEGRKDCRPEEIEMTDCTFEMEPRTPEYDPYVWMPNNAIYTECLGVPIFSEIRDLRLNNTSFLQK